LKKYGISEWKRNLKNPGRISLKAKHFIYLCSVVQCVKLTFMIKNFEFRKMKRSNAIELLKLSIEKVLKKYGK